MHPQLSDGGRRLLHSNINTQQSDTNIGTASIPLSPLPPSPTHRQPPHPEDDDEADPESTSALLRQHIRDSASDDDEAAPTDAHTSQHIGLFQRISGLMSKTPLLLRTAPGFGAGSYGAAPIGASTENSAEEDNADVRSRTKRKTRQSGLRNTVGTGVGRGSKPSRSNPEISSQSGTSRRPSIPQTPLSDPEEREVIDDIGVDDGLGVGVLPIPSDAGHIGIGTSKDGLPTVSDDGDLAENEDEISSDEDEEDPSDNSPYPQVRASVSAVDNTTLSINTPRMWALSMLFAILGSSTNLFFSLRYPSVSITPVIALLLVHPLGLLWDQFLKRDSDPDEEFIDGVKTSPNNATTYESSQGASIARRLRLYLAQGKWNEKEHSCVYISSNVSFGFAFATDVIVEQTQFYNQKVSIMYQLLLILSTQILGYTFAGLARRFLVRPGGMIWPGTLMSAAMFTTLHKEKNVVANGWTMTRWKLFFIVWLSAFLFYFLPGLLMPALSYFSVITWFAPKNVIIANLFGVSSGLGMFPITFDWAQIAYIGSPLLTPFWAAMNVVGGLVIVMWIIAPIAYYKNMFWSSYMPILSSSVFDNTGKIYDVNKILTPEFLFDREAYRKYSRVFLPITYVLSYGLQFAALASLLTHTTCWHGPDIWRQWRRSLQEVGDDSKPIYKAVSSQGDRGSRRSSTSNGGGRLRLERSDSHMENIISQEDVHNRLMRRYKDTPLSWYLITLVSMTAVGIFVVE
jgi:hypothetical protein